MQQCSSSEDKEEGNVVMAW